MKDGTTFCLFKTKQEIMAKEEKQNIIRQFSERMAEAIRWSKRTYHPKSEAIPKNHFYSPEELEYLSQTKRVPLLTNGLFPLANGHLKTRVLTTIPYKVCRRQNGKWIDGYMDRRKAHTWHKRQTDWHLLLEGARIQNFQNDTRTWRKTTRHKAL